jgi:hypothetical protein
LHKCLSAGEVNRVATAGGMTLEWSVGHVGIAGVDTVFNHQCPAWPPILPRSTYDFEPRGNTTLRANTISAIQGVARLGEQIWVPKAVPIVPDCKQEWNLPLEDRTGYHEERCAVWAHNDELGKLITQQSELFENTSWERFVSTLRGRGNFARPHQRKCNRPPCLRPAEASFYQRCPCYHV